MFWVRGERRPGGLVRVVVVVKRIVMTAALLPAVACTPAPKPVDLLQAGGPLLEAGGARGDKTAVLGHPGRPPRMWGGGRRAHPPGSAPPHPISWGRPQRGAHTLA